MPDDAIDTRASAPPTGVTVKTDMDGETIRLPKAWSLASLLARDVLALFSCAGLTTLAVASADLLSPAARLFLGLVCIVLIALGLTLTLVRGLQMLRAVADTESHVVRVDATGFSLGRQRISWSETTRFTTRDDTLRVVHQDGRVTELRLAHQSRDTVAWLASRLWTLRATRAPGGPHERPDALTALQRAAQVPEG